jgi:hypothetical protein
VKNLVSATEQLLDRLEIPRSIADLGISKEEFERAMPDLAKIAFDDPSWRSNPRMPLVSELVEVVSGALIFFRGAPDRFECGRSAGNVRGPGRRQRRKGRVAGRQRRCLQSAQAGEAGVTILVRELRCLMVQQ